MQLESATEQEASSVQLIPAAEVETESNAAEKCQQTAETVVEGKDEVEGDDENGPLN